MVRSRQNHYETLGVSPTAGREEIAQAFARETSVFRPQVFGRITEVCVAYEVLRNPAKRRAYDASLGLRPEPAAATASSTPAPPAPSSPHPVLGTRPGRPATPQANPEPRVEPLAERPSPPTEPQIDSGPAFALALEDRFGLEVRPIEWRRMAMLLGAVVVGACLLGALVGWWSVSDVAEAGPPVRAAPASRPPANPAATAAAPWLDPAPHDFAELPDRRPAAVATAPPRRRPAAAPIAAVKSLSEQSQLIQSEPDSGLSERPATESEQARAEAEPLEVAAPPASATAASLPLPSATIARTIDRIGYACGKVASAAAVDEAPGVYKITCTSGQSYQAKPVNGRYRFRRWGRQ